MIFLISLFSCQKVDQDLFEQHFYRCLLESRALIYEPTDRGIPGEIIEQCRITAKELATK